MRKVSCFFSCIFIFTFYAGTQQLFKNPLLPSGADPWVTQKDGFYYYMHTTGRDLNIWKTKWITELKSAEHKKVWTPPDSTAYSKQIWAPELHFINDKWYIYFAADNGKNENHRIYVLENSSSDPLQGEWVMKGKITDGTDKWAIDASVFKHKRKWYMIWSGWEADTNGRQDIYIAKMKSPWTIDGERVRISSPVFDWERNGALNDSLNPPNVYVNESPQILKNKKKLFLIYSASGCWTDEYALGMLHLKGRRKLLDSSRWRKSPEPVFKKSIENGVYAPGHNSFYQSPDGTEDWIIYHANSKPAQGCGRNRSPRTQKFIWNRDGSPYFGVPVKEGELLPIPTEDKAVRKSRTDRSKVMLVPNLN
ncbi:MAG: family 43 glycosylhydrolase [Chitinophagaceae bacterium]